MTVANLEQNKTVCKRFLTHVAGRRFADALALVSEDIVWWEQGTFSFSGYHNGRAAVAALLKALEANLIDDMTIQFGAITAEQDRVAVEMVSKARLTRERIYNNTYHFLFTVKAGLITHCREYLDTQHTYEMLFAK